jgi:4-hydroxythreonine-4-phosphate dehydrogenase
MIRRERIKRIEIIAITLGDPQGIGPEIVYKSIKNYRSRFALVIIGDKDSFPNESVQTIADIEEIRRKGKYFYHIQVPSTGGKDPSYEFVRQATGLALQNKIQALVTAPVSKEKWLRAGIPFKGHTEFLAHSAGTKNYSMFFWSKDLKVVLFTIHIPLKDIFRCITGDKIIHFIRFVDGELSRLFKKKFTFLVSGLNPHAGEDGFMGTEEQDVIIPAIRALKPEISIDGPYPPDTIFIKARETKDSVVLSWYHDQGLIAFKLLNLHSGVNMTLGLPFIRTSPDHGTAFDIAGKGIANPSSMKQAIRLAESLVKLR